MEEEKNQSSMYDRLGDLLSQTLEKGSAKIVSNDQIIREKEDLEKKKLEEEIEEERQQLHEEVEQRLKAKKAAEEKKRKEAADQEKKRTGKGTVIKSLSPELERAYRLLNVSYGSSSEEIKKAYRERLMYFHPDKHKDNPVLQKVANDKTRQILEAYDLILKNL